MSVDRYDTSPMQPTEISVLGMTREKLHSYKELFHLEDFDHAIRDLFRRVEGGAPLRAPQTRPVVIPAPSVPTAEPSRRRRTWALCGSTRVVRGRLVSCRREVGHEDKHAWWSSGRNARPQDRREWW